MKIAIVQFNPSFGETERNLDTVERLLEPVSADVVVLPELFSTGYLFVDEPEVVRLAEPLDGGPTLQRVQQWARGMDCAIAAGFAEASPDGPYNSAVLMSAEGVLAHYRKIHLFDR